MTVTALSAGNSSANPESKDIFSSEETILRALSFVRHSPISVKEKDALRDLFLNYSGTYDDVRRSEIRSQIISLLGSRPELSPLLPKKKATDGSTMTKSADGIGATRPVPSFASPSGTIAEPDIRPTKVKDGNEKPPTNPMPKSNDGETPAVVKSPTPVDKPAPGPQQAPAIDAPGAKTRIDAIKRDINGKFGNPVNLIDQNEKVGREYMAALLDAMKRAAKGDPDLSRLEAAYQEALTISPHAAVTPTRSSDSPPVSPTSEPKDSTSPEIAAPALRESKEPPASSPVVSEVATDKPMEQSPTLSSGSGLYHRPIDDVEETSVRPLTDATEKKNFPPATGRQHASAEEVTSSDVLPSTIERTPSVKIEATPKEAATSKPETPKSPVNDDATRKPLPVKDIDTTLPEQISKLKSAAAAREEAAKKPITDLNAPEIDQGLKQLLSEWSLFKGGGIFRSRPSGIDNALYKQLSKLPMASVVSGRFEGVTPEIKRELADYMTGWRYERGVVHEMGETFEHYLRRVVKEILEKQRRAVVSDAIANDEK